MTVNSRPIFLFIFEYLVEVINGKWQKQPGWFTARLSIQIFCSFKLYILHKI